MRHYTQILVWENNRRISEIAEFSKDLVVYANNSEYSWKAEGVIEKQAALEARAHLNLSLDEIGKIVSAAGINTVYSYSPPPMIGGYEQQIDLFLNLFNLSQFQINLEIVRDLLVRALGVYQRNHRAALLRTVNPLTYLGILLEWIASLPFRLLGRAGFNASRAEHSLLGRVAKFLIEAIIVLASVATVLDFLGWTDKVRTLLSPYLR